MDPILLDIPESFATERLTLRVPRPGDGATLARSVRASLFDLRRWIPWATDAYGDGDGELWCRRAYGEFFTRRTTHFMIFDRDGHAGHVGAYKFDWDARTCEVGYWLRADRVGRGYMTDALDAFAAVLHGRVGMRRIERRCDTRNDRSAAVARRCGFALDGTLRGDALGTDGEPCDTNIFSRLAGETRAVPD